MKPSKLIHSLIVPILGWPNQALGLFNSNSQVIDMSGLDFEKRIHKTKHVTLVKFYAPWCGHCKNLAPIYDEVASKIKGVAKLVAINCDEELNKPICSKYGIQGFPTLKLFPSSVVLKGGKKQPIDYNGERSKKAIKDFILNAIPDTTKKIVPNHKVTKYSQGIDTFLENNPGAPLPKVILFSEKPAAQPIYKSLALEFYDRASFGLILKKETELINLFGVEKFPSLIVIPVADTEQSEPKLNKVEYKDEFSFNKLKNFLEQYAAPKKVRSSKTKNEKETKPVDKEMEEAFDPEVMKLTEQDEFEKECLNDAEICILNLIPTEQANLIQALKEVKKKVYEVKRKLAKVSDLPIKFFYSPILPTTFLMKQFEIGDVPSLATLVLQPRHKLFAYKVFADTEDLQTDVSAYLESGVKGKVKFYPYSFVPKLKKVKKPKPKQGSDYDEL